ncbi:MAG: WYL domain-containing protein [Leptolyngbya sp. Prado105]|nr:WYL domain-containing protein [Leptolyngbya sp. Prado105]
MNLHSYSESDSFIRLMMLIATLVHHPGVGAEDVNETGQSDAMQAVFAQMRQIAQELDLALPEYSVHTIRKDLRTLRKYGILDRRMYRWGYYLGTGALTQMELSIALQALMAQAQGDPTLKRVYETLERRLRGLNLDLKGQLLYPVRTQLQRSIIYTDPAEMMLRGHYRHSLLERVDELLSAILRGDAIELYQRSNPYVPESSGQFLQVYPLQMIYADIAWYVLCEQLEDGHFVMIRLDRLSDHFRVVGEVQRGLEVQFEQLKLAHRLLSRGWGLYLGDVEAQRLERSGQLEFVTAIVRFFPPVLDFILEGERRHPTQKVRRQEGYVDYQVSLPERSMAEFLQWVNRFMGAAQVLAPDSLRRQHYEAALRLVGRYEKNL